MKKDKNLACYWKQIYKPPLQFSGLCGTTFVSYLLQRFMQLKEARKGFFGCYSLCETMKDIKEG